MTPLTLEPLNHDSRTNEKYPIASLNVCTGSGIETLVGTAARPLKCTDFVCDLVVPNWGEVLFEINYPNH